MLSAYVFVYNGAMENILIFGAVGGVARGLVGLAKYYASYKNVQFSLSYFLITVGISASVGLAVVWAIDGSGITLIEGLKVNPATAFIIGYAGGDAIENIYKIILRKPLLGPIRKK